MSHLLEVRDLAVSFRTPDGTVEAVTMGNLVVRVKLVGSAVPSAEHIQALIRVGGWDGETVARAADQVRILLQALVKEYTEHSDIREISSPALTLGQTAKRS